MRTRNKKSLLKKKKNKKRRRDTKKKSTNSSNSNSSNSNSSNSKSSRPSSSSSSSSKHVECMICLEKIDKNNLSEISCSNNHLFHDECMKQWLNVKSTCPTCREDLLPNNKAMILKTINILEERFDIYTEQYKKFMKVNKHFKGAGHHKTSQLKKIERDIISEIKIFNSLYEAIEDLLMNEETREFISSKTDGLYILNKIIQNIEDQAKIIFNSLNKYIDNRRTENLQGIYNLEDFNKYEKNLKKIDFIKRPEIMARFDKDLIRHTQSI